MRENEGKKFKMRNFFASISVTLVSLVDYGYFGFFLDFHFQKFNLKKSKGFQTIFKNDCFSLIDAKMNEVIGPNFIWIHFRIHISTICLEKFI
jgi:hypothetical protein